MNNPSTLKKEKIIVTVPSNSDQNIPGAILSVKIGVDEQVEWVWTHLKDGKSAVTGYKITKKSV